MKLRSFSSILTAAVLTVAFSASAFAADDWPMFRRDAQRTGATDQAILGGVLQPNRPRPIWVYPTPVPVVPPIDNDFGAIDVPEFVAQPRGVTPTTWQDSSAIVAEHAPNATNDNYLFIPTTFSATEQFEAWLAAPSKPSATWTLDNTAAVASASYYIYVWFPSTSVQESPFIQTRDAHYIVEDVQVVGLVTTRTVLGRFTLDQTSGEAWINLGSDPFEAKAGHSLEVILTNETQEQNQGSSSAPTGIVIADAVQFVQDTGTVLSSPVLSQTPTVDPILLSCPILTKPMGVVANQDATRDIGVVNGINTENDILTLLDDRGLLNWSFPENSNNWIQNGATSTPAVANIGGEELAIIPAGDGQVYAVRTVATAALPVGTPRLAWQGPGYTLNDPTSQDAVTWTAVNTEPGYQGANFLRATATQGGAGTAHWAQAGIAAGAYGVFVWIPPSTALNPLFGNVRYTVTVTGLPTATVFISQRNGGQWVRLGTYAIPAAGTVTVDLINNTGPALGQPAQYVAADALKVVPSDLAAFEVSSPVVDTAGDIYVGGENGRIYKLRVGQQTPVWVYPDPNQLPAITVPTDPKYPAPNSIGAITGSPALSVDQATLYVGSLDGYVYAINTANGTRKWRYPDASDTTHNLGEVSSTTAVGNRIYVAVGGVSSGFTYDASGRVVALIDNGANATVDWWNPGDPNVVPDQVGEFLYSSPLLMDRPAVAVPLDPGGPSLYVGSTDGFFYGMNATTGAALTNQIDGTTWNPTDLVDMVLSSPAGTVIRPGYTRAGGAPSGDPIPFAFVGSDNNRIYGIDLRDGFKDWFWNLFGFVFSSPAIAKERIYVADEGGFTWAFTSKNVGSAGGEDWNIATGVAEAPTGGSETGATDNQMIDMDIYSKAAWDAWVPSTPNHHTGSITDAEGIYEWGERIYFVIWGIRSPASPASKIQVSLKSRGRGRQATSGTEAITIPAGEIKPALDANGVQLLDVNGDPIYYAKYWYALDGSNAQRTATPGARVAMAVTEGNVVTGRDQQTGAAFVPNDISSAGVKTSFIPMYITINNPLGFRYQDPIERMDVGVTPGTFTTTKAAPKAGMNGNFFDFPTRTLTIGPFIRAANGTAHGTVSAARENIIVDRSLMGSGLIDDTGRGRQLSKFRIDFSDFGWGMNAGRQPTWLPWEMDPTPGPWNKSTDYPGIPEQDGIAKVSATGIDPSKISVGLIGTPKLAAPAGGPPASWPVGQNGVQFSVNVPRFQPANWPGGDMATALPGILSGTGYTGRVRAYIDSNNNGRYDSAWGGGARQLRRRGRGGVTNRTEAFREFFLQAHVLPDLHIAVAEKTIDIGQAPHGFGLVRDTAGLPVVFYDRLADNLAAWDPATNSWGFNDWFKPFTVYNQGNVNILNLRAYQPYLRSDTVNDLYGITGLLGLALPGARIAGAHTVTSIDPLFVDDGPGYSPLTGMPRRSLHKAKVGEDAPVLMIPDAPGSLYPTIFASQNGGVGPLPEQGQKVPRLSVAVPIGQPAGTYYGKFTLYNDVNDDGLYVVNGTPEPGESLGDPTINLAVTVSEDRMTDGAMMTPGGMRGVIPQIDNDPAVPNTGDMSPAAYRDPTTGNVHMFWSSSRYGKENTGRAAAAPLTTDPWYLYVSTLNTATAPWDKLNPGWAFDANSPQWWMPTGLAGAPNVSNPFPAAAYLPSTAAGSFFPAPTAAFPNLGAPGDTKTDTVKFNSPSIAVDSITKRVWAFFLGQAYKTGIQTPENRSYETEITGETLSADVFDTDRPTPGSILNIDGDWTTPKYGFRGIASHMQRVDTDPTRNLFLWTFWFGGNNGKWRIFYNSNIDPDGKNVTPGKDNWTNSAQLPMPKGLISMAEPAPFYRENVYWDDKNGKPYKDLLDVVYSGYSSFHKNSDIYLSRYQPNTVPDKRNGSLQMFGNEAWRLPIRGADYFFDDANTAWYPKTGNSAGYIPFAKLSRSITGGVWYANDTDWDPLIGFHVMVFMKTNTGALANWTKYELTTPDGVRDSKTGTWIYNFAKDPPLRTLFRGIIVDPAAGTVKFLRSPARNALVVASYTPRAYRLTTDNATDDSPFVIMDHDGNPAYTLGNPAGNPFNVPSAWDVNKRPDTDRLWVFWRRPGINKPGSGIHYKTYRYGIQLGTQIAVNAINGAPLLASVTPLAITDGGWPLTTPVEVDWAKNKLYFSSAEEGNKVTVSYSDKTGASITMLATVELTEELGPSKEGSVFGNLTQLMVNEGQVSAFKDRVEDPANGTILEDRVWTFWTSTRSGNTDIYYETISPRFYGVNF